MVGNISTAASQCSNNRDGPLCTVCKVGYTSLTSDGECTPCGSTGTSVSTTILFTGVLLVALGVLYWSVLREDSALVYSEYYAATKSTGAAARHHQSVDKRGSGTGLGGAHAPSDTTGTTTTYGRSSFSSRASMVEDEFTAVTNITRDELVTNTSTTSANSRGTIMDGYSKEMQARWYIAMTTESRQPRTFTFTLKVIHPSFIMSAAFHLMMAC